MHIDSVIQRVMTVENPLLSGLDTLQGILSEHGIMYDEKQQQGRDGLDDIND